MTGQEMKVYFSPAIFLPLRVSFSRAASTSNVSSVVQRNRFIHQHDWNVMANGIKEFAVCAHQSTVNFLRHRLAAAILQRARRDLLIQPCDQRGFSPLDGLVRLRAAKDFQKFGINHVWFSGAL